MAFAADQHGYPGPMHVLELKERESELLKRPMSTERADAPSVRTTFPSA